MLDPNQDSLARETQAQGPFQLDSHLLAASTRRAKSEALEIEILTMAGQINAAQYRFLKLLVEFDDHGGWQSDGIHSFAHWLNWKVGMGMVMAREKVRVARSLADLPMINEAFSSGKVSYSKVRAMTRVATPENETFLLQIAEYGTASHMEYLVRKYQHCKRLQEPNEDESWRCQKDLSWYQEETGMYVINARLPPEEGALVIRALEIIQAEDRRSNKEAEDKTELKVDSNNVSAESSPVEDFSAGMTNEDSVAARASALTHLAEQFLDNMNTNANLKRTGGSLGEKYQVFLHVNANAANLDWQISNADSCCVDHKHFLSPNVAKQLACDASLTTVLEDDQGNVLNIGRRSRTVPRAMSHALRIRDGGCRFPGCCRSQYTDSHHIKHWAQGGETSMENLVTLCRSHHTLLHKGEYRLARDESGDLVFTNNRNEVICQSFYPQFPNNPPADGCLDPLIDEQRAISKWQGESMDIQQALQCMFELG